MNRIEGRELSFQIWVCQAFGFSNYSLCTRRTDRRTDRSTKATLIAPSLYGVGIIITGCIKCPFINQFLLVDKLCRLHSTCFFSSGAFRNSAPKIDTFVYRAIRRGWRASGLVTSFRWRWQEIVLKYVVSHIVLTCYSLTVRLCLQNYSPHTVFSFSHFAAVSYKRSFVLRCLSYQVY